MDLHELFEMVEKKNASDLLISVGAPPILRVNGKLFRTRSDALTAEQTQKAVYAILTPDQIAHFEKNKELDLSLAAGRNRRFRVNVYYQKGGVTAAFRPIPEKIPSLEDLGLPPVVEEFAKAKQGLLLVTGPTGHGKTTTQASIIDLINNTREVHVITVEDPIEYLHKHKKSIVDQREVGATRTASTTH
jgi:twitching motility protein PilT